MKAQEFFSMYCKAASDDEAVGWCITDGLQFVAIVNSRNVITANPEERWVYKKVQNAENTLKNLQTGKNTKDIYSAFKVYSCPKKNIESAAPPEIEQNKNEAIPDIIDCHASEFSENILKRDEIDDWEIIYAKIFDFFRVLPDYYKELSQELAIRERELMDLRHYIELQKFNAVEGYKLAKTMKKVLQERRVLKDKIKILSAFSDNPDSESNAQFSIATETTLINRFKAAAATIESLEDRKYRPRHCTDIKNFINK